MHENFLREVSTAATGIANIVNPLRVARANHFRAAQRAALCSARRCDSRRNHASRARKAASLCYQKSNCGRISTGNTSLAAPSIRFAESLRPFTLPVYFCGNRQNTFRSCAPAPEASLRINLAIRWGVLCEPPQNCQRAARRIFFALLALAIRDCAKHRAPPHNCYKRYFRQGRNRRRCVCRLQFRCRGGAPCRRAVHLSFEPHWLLPFP